MPKEQRLQPSDLPTGPVAAVVQEPGRNGEGARRHEVPAEVPQHSHVVDSEPIVGRHLQPVALPQDRARSRRDSELSYTRAALAMPRLSGSAGGQIDVVVQHLLSGDQGKRLGLELPVEGDVAEARLKLHPLNLAEGIGDRTPTRSRLVCRCTSCCSTRAGSPFTSASPGQMHR